MKKFLLLAISLLIISTQTFASVANTLNQDPLIEIGHGVKITYSEFIKLTPKEYKRLTGHRLGIKKTIGLKIIQKKLSKQPNWSGGKNQLVAALLAFAIGYLGVHRFYLGYTWQGIVQILTLGGLGIWALIDFIRILTGDLQPKDGEYDTPL